MFNVVLGIVAQLVLNHFPNVPDYGNVLLLYGLPVGILAVIILILKRTWWNRLED
jgi:SSS family solute:Na+ symporter